MFEVDFLWHSYCMFAWARSEMSNMDFIYKGDLRVPGPIIYPNWSQAGLKSSLSLVYNQKEKGNYEGVTFYCLVIVYWSLCSQYFTLLSIWLFIGIIFIFRLCVTSTLQESLLPWWRYHALLFYLSTSCDVLNSHSVVFSVCLLCSAYFVTSNLFCLESFWVLFLPGYSFLGFL